MIVKTIVTTFLSQINGFNAYFNQLRLKNLFHKSFSFRDEIEGKLADKRTWLYWLSVP